MLSSVLLLLLISGAQASYYGVVFSYSVGDLQPDGYPESNNFKVSFSSCEEFNSWLCGGECSEFPVYPVDERRSDWCQTSYIQTLPVSFLSALDYPFDATNWTENRNGIELSAATLLFEIRNRSDINKPNSSPQTTIIPLLRVPSNCQRNIDLLVSDPDGDDIRCRYAAGSECNICTPPSVLSVSSSCSLSFSPTNSSAEGPYAVQMVVEDFTGQNITLTNGNNSQEVKPQNDAISKIPVQFVFRVDPAAPSCTEGEYLPRFLPPTPEHGAQILTNVNQTLEIIVRAEATQAETTELLFSGPIGLAKSSSGSGNFSLTWTPSARDAGLKQTLCFVVQANSSGSVYQSDFRCVFVTTGSTAATVSPPTTTATPSTMFMTIQPPFTTTLPPTTPPPTTPPPTTPPPTTTAPTTTAPPPTTTAPPPTTTTPPPTMTSPPPTTTAPPPTTTTPPPTTTSPPPTTTTPPPTTPPPTTTAPPPTTTTPPPTTPPPTTPPPTTTTPPPTTPPPTTTAPPPTTTSPPPTTPPPTTTAPPPTTPPPTTTTPPPTTPPPTTPPPTTTAPPPTTPPPTTTTPPPTTTAPPPTTTTPPPTTTAPPPTTTAPPPTTTAPPPTTTAPPPTTTAPPPTTTAPPPPPTTTITPPITTTPPQTTTDQPTTTTALPSTTIVFPPTTNQPTATFAPGPYYALALNVKLYTSLLLENDSATIIKLIKDELKRRGLPPDIMLKLLSDGVVKATA
ncbi:mucin-5AC-like [Xiphophorus hellerii]|uniref:mucin-5AC-like n=1 Tax=Xiphophorus hellerii TaxID=8084 RepID=UPI0013B3EF12|nr:mucin-5AC-like [Xiphophorus hellerii]